MNKQTINLIYIIFFLLLFLNFPIKSYAETQSVDSEKGIVISENQESVPLLKEATKNSTSLISIPNQSEITILDKETNYTYISYFDPLTNKQFIGYIENSQVQSLKEPSVSESEISSTTPTNEAKSASATANHNNTNSSDSLQTDNEIKTSSAEKSLSGITPAKVYVYSSTSISSKILKSYPKGCTLKYKEYTANWYQTTVYINNQPYTGYIEKSAMEGKASVRTASQSIKGVTYYVKGASILNVRKGAGIKYKKITSISKGAKVTLYSKKGNWGKIKTSSAITGWASLYYLSKTAPSKGLKGKVIVIDAGHGGKDPGAVSGGKREKDLTLRTAKKLKLLLEKAGAKVIMTRSGDTYPDLSERVKISHANKADAFISLHFNASSSSGAKGIDTFYWKTNVNEFILAQSIQSEVIKTTKLSNRGTKTGNFHVIRENNSPAVLIELGFITNPTERKTISTSSYQTKAATGIFNGLKKYFDL